MPRYIDADWLIAEANKDGAYGYVSADQIAKAPTADVVEVVGCNDCIHCDMGWEPYPGAHYCPMIDVIVKGDWFCADGERKEITGRAGEKEKKNMKSNKEEKKQNSVETLKLESFELRRATEGKGGVVYFDAIINGIWIYGMKVVPLHDGTGDFVAWPSQKGADGKYYNVAYAKFDPETEKSILKAVQEKLDE